MANDFSGGSIQKTILLQAIPLFFAQLVQLLYNVVDRIYIGHLPEIGSVALTGVGVVFPLISLITAFTDWFGMGGAALFSIARGAGKEERARRLLGTTAFLLLVASLFITGLGIFLEKPLLTLFGASEQSYGYARAYLQIYILGTVFFMTSSGLNYFINAQGFPRMGMLTTMLGAVLNIVLDPIFIFAFRMGVRGAALATILSQTASALWVLRFLRSRQALYPLEKRYVRFDPGLCREIMSLGFAGFVMKATNGLVQAVNNIQLRAYGGDLYIGIIIIINSIRDIIQLPGSSIPGASQPVLGFQFGAREYRRLRSGILFQVSAAASYAVLAWALVMLFPGAFLRIFSSDPETLRVGTHAARIYFAAFIFMIGQTGGQSVFVALGKSRYAIFFSLLRKVVIVVPLTLILPHFFGVNGIYAAEPISNVLGGCAAFTTMIFRIYRRLPREDGVAAEI